VQRLFLNLVVLFVGCLTMPANLSAEDAADYFSRGNILQNNGDFDKAIAAYSQAVRIVDVSNPTHVAMIFSKRGTAWANKGNYDKAIADFDQALPLFDSKDVTSLATVWCWRGSAWASKGEYGKAIADLNQALAINPKYGNAFYNRGVSWYKAGEYGKAIADYSQVLTFDPSYAQAYAGLAWIEATCPDEKYRDGKKAVENASKAYQRTERTNWHCICTLAAAYAESGDFEKAKEWQAKAVELAAPDKSATDKDRQEMRARLELYKQGKPYREEMKRQ
jgi:tetratricopeptide (TPR) repeat protein